MLLVDDRWTGQHGIGRFASEVIGRIGLPFRRLGGPMPPASPLDVVNPARARLKRSDVVYSPGYNAGFTAAAQLLTVHDLIYLQGPKHESSLRREYFARIVRPAIIRAGRVMTSSRMSARALREWLGTDRVSVVDVGIGCSDAFTRDGASCPSRGEYLLYVGNTSKPHKNFPVLLRALARRPEYTLVVVAEANARVDRLAADAGVSAQVSTLSGVPDPALAQLYRGSNGLLFPSLLEGVGLPAVEAMRCGKRVAFWSGCEALSEVVGEAGVAVNDAASADEWAAAMDALMAAGPPGEAEAQRLASRTTSYTWDAVAAKVERELAVGP